MKNIFKEIIITLLLCIAILLILSIMFYDYNPLNKVVPSTVSYVTPNEVKEETTSKEVIEEFNDIPITYNMTSSDLNIYKKSQSYVAGKSNPFGNEIIGDQTSADTTGSGSTAGTSTTSGQTTTSTSTNPDSTGTFLKSSGGK